MAMDSARGIVGNYAGRRALPPHCAKHLHGQLVLIALFAGADYGTIGEYVKHDTGKDFPPFPKIAQKQMVRTPASTKGWVPQAVGERGVSAAT